MKQIDVEEALNEIIGLKRKLNNIPGVRFTKSPLGDTGELYAWLELEKKGYGPKLLGGSSKVDIILKHSKKVEVRTSLLKNEGIFPKGINFYGWRVQTEAQLNKSASLPFDYLICIAVDSDYSTPRFYIFSKKECEKMPVIIKFPRFGSIKKKIQLFETYNSYKLAQQNNPAIISSLEDDLNKNPSKYKDRWSIIK